MGFVVNGKATYFVKDLQRSVNPIMMLVFAIAWSRNLVALLNSTQVALLVYIFFYLGFVLIFFQMLFPIYADFKEGRENKRKKLIAKSIDNLNA
jgi:hypothetical protein